MKSAGYILVGLLVLFLKRNENTFALAAWSIQTQSIPEEHLEAIKVEFSKPVVEALLRFNGFHRKFGVPYLYVKSALTYATEIAKATAYSPLFSSIEGIEDFALKHLLRMVLSCSPVYCTDVNCVATTIGEILAEIITEGGFVTHRVSHRVLKMYAGNLAGNILWRLTRLPDPDSHIVESLRDAPNELVTAYSKFLRTLSLGIRNSTLLYEFCEDEGIDADASIILLRGVCGSQFLKFKLGLLGDLSEKMFEIYTFSKKVLPQDLESSQLFSVISSILAETITFGIIKQEYLRGDENVEEISHDVLKMILLGVTSSKMNLGLSNSFVKYSSLTNKKVSERSKSPKQTVLEKISSDLYASEIFQRLFNSTHIPSSKLLEYSSAMAEGIAHSSPNISDEVSASIAEQLHSTLLSTSMSDASDSSNDTVKLYSSDVSKTLVDIVLKLELVDFNTDLRSVLITINEIIENIIHCLEILEERRYEVRESSEMKESIDKFVPKRIMDVMSTISNFFSSIF